MKAVKTTVYLLIACVSALASETTIPITDEVSPERPLANTGRVTVSETVASGQLLLSRRDEWSVKNVSQRTIIAFVEVMYTQYPDGRNGARTAQYDAFFDSRLFKPGDVLDYSRVPYVKKSPALKEYEPVEATSIVKVRWVQFSDGSSSGDAKYAAQLMEMRQGVLSALTHLSDVYKTQGAEEFLKELDKQCESPLADGYIAHLRYFHKNEDHDAQQTFERVQAHLQIGEQRSRFVR